MTAPEHLISIAVGPVQEFIASSRKLRDLWYGSDLLSELSKAVVRSLAEQGCELIFPMVENHDALTPHSDLIVANKILALAPAGQDPTLVIAQAKQFLQGYWQDVCDQVRRQLPAGCIDETLYVAQAKDFGEFFGVWTTIDGEYRLARRRAEQLLAGRKSLREFQAPTWPGAGKAKSSLDGIRESAILRSEPLMDQFILKKGEELDVLGIVKRKGIHTKPRDQWPKFDTLSEVAVQPYMEGLANDPHAQEILRSIADLNPLRTKYKIATPPDSTDCLYLPKGFRPEWLLPACLADIEREFATQDDPAWKELASCLRQLYQHAGQPQPYACLLVGDGDHMGAALDDLDTKEGHKRFSSIMDGFARAMQTLVPAYGGGLIYSGGDDVMAYLPLHTALACVCAIQERFALSMAEACHGTSISTQPTFSAGIAIVHHHMPLHSALDLARRAEKTAKNQGGRNALAIIQAKRSGAEQRIHGRWKAVGDLAPFHLRMQTMVSLHKEGAFPSRLGHQLRRIAAQTGARMEWVDGKVSPNNATAAEALRLVARKRQLSGSSITEEDQRTLLAGRTDLRQLADELVIAKQFASAIRLAKAGWLNKEDRHDTDGD